MAADEAGEKTEQPTPRRRQEAREEGQVSRSADLTASIVLLGAMVLLNLLGPGIFGRMLELVREMSDLSDTDAAGINIWIVRAVSAAASMVLPFLALLLVVTVAGSLSQTGLLFTVKKLQPKLENLSLSKGIKKLFSLDSVTRAGLGMFKMGLVGVVAWFTVVGQIQPVLGSANVEPLGVLQMAASLVFMLALRMSLILLLLGLLDYMYQRWQTEKKLMMTRQQVRDELKRMEGDPVLKQRRRQTQARLAMQRVQTDVPRADVIVTNPTEFAVALRYDETAMKAPRVLAKGQDLVALRIRQVAQLHGVPIVQRPPLARALYAAVDVGEEVPAEYYRAVAEVLAYVYQLSGRAAG